MPDDPELYVFHVADTEWWVAESAELAIQAFREQVGEPEASELLSKSDPVEALNDEDLDRMKITDIDEPGHPQRTFREAFEEVQALKLWPVCIASSEY